MFPYCITLCIDIHINRSSHPRKTVNLLLKTNVLFRVTVFPFHEFVTFVSVIFESPKICVCPSVRMSVCACMSLMTRQA